MQIEHKIDYQEWSDFVYSHPNENIFQTPEMYKVYQNTKNYEPIFIAVLNGKDEILATLLAVVQKEHPSGFLGKFSARSIIWGGPLVRDGNIEVLDFILKEYDKVIKNQTIYTQIRNLGNFSEQKDIFYQNGYKYEEHLNILINLNKNIEEIKKDFTSNRRYGIRRAEREGVHCYEEDSLELLKQCYLILEGVYSYAKLPIPDFNFFESLYLYSTKRTGLKIFVAKYENKIIGCMLALVYKDTVYDFYAGSYHNYYNKYPNDLIPWFVFLWAKKRGYKLFDFGGAGNPKEEYGVRDYKKQYGGEFVNFGRFEKFHKPILMTIGKFGFKIWQKIK